MKRHFKFIIVSFLAIPILLLNFAPVLADTGSFTKVKSGFTVDQNQAGIFLKPGSTIHHLSTGITEVYGPDRALQLKADDSESDMVITPYGLKKASDIYSVPDGAKIDYGSQTTQIFDSNNNLLLTVVYDEHSKKAIVPNTQAWLAQTYDTGLNIDYFTAYWNVPNSPPNRNDTDFYWNGIQNPSGATLLQPVLQWNQVGYSNEWSVQTWALWPNGGLAKGGVTVVSKGNVIGGRLQIVGNYWYILVNVNGGNWNGIEVGTNILGTSNDTVLNVLECARPDNKSFVNNDLPGNCYFTSETFKYNGNSIPIYWHSQIATQYGLNLTVKL